MLGGGQHGVPRCFCWMWVQAAICGNGRREKNVGLFWTSARRWERASSGRSRVPPPFWGVAVHWMRPLKTHTLHRGRLSMVCLKVF